MQTDGKLLAFQLGTLVLVFILGMIGGLLPVKVHAFRHNMKCVSIANSFSAGVFLAVAFMHLIPEANEDYMAFRAPKEDVFPFGYLLVVIGYLIILFIEKVAFDPHGEFGHNHQATPLKSFVSSRIWKDEEQNQLPVPSLDKKEREVDEYMANRSLVSSHGRITDKLAKSFQNDASELPKETKEDMKSELDPYLVDQKQTDLLNPHRQKKEGKKQSIVKSVLLLFALGSHAIFEGIAIGLQDTTAHILNIAIGTCAHKWSASLALGISFVHVLVDKDKIIILLVVIFNLCSPIGIVIGIFISGSSECVEFIFLALAAGTFVYISASEVIVEEFEIASQKFIKFGFLILGTAIISALALIE